MKALRMSEEEYRAYVVRTTKTEVRDATHSEQIVTPTVIATKRQSKLEDRLDQQIFEAGIPSPWRNWFPIPNRDFELDRAWPALKIAVEVQGMAHRIKGKFKRDMEKRALCMLAGWKVLEVGGAEIRSGKAIEWLKELLREEA